MSYFRSYFEKNNTLLKDSSTNTAKNPTTELIYGSTFSKFIFKVDFGKIASAGSIRDKSTLNTGAISHDCCENKVAVQSQTAELPIQLFSTINCYES